MDKMFENLDKNTKLVSFGRTERVKAQIVNETKQYQITEIQLDIKKTGDEYEIPVWVTIYEDMNGDKRITVNGALDMEMWNDVMGYIKTHI